MDLSTLNAELFSAVQEGNVDRVQTCLENGANDLDGALVAAATMGNIDIVIKLVWAGARNFEDAMIAAAKLGHDRIVELCKFEFGISPDVAIVQELTGRVAHSESLATMTAGQATMCVEPSQVLNEVASSCK